MDMTERCQVTQGAVFHDERLSLVPLQALFSDTRILIKFDLFVINYNILYIIIIIILQILWGKRICGWSVNRMSSEVQLAICTRSVLPGRSLLSARSSFHSRNCATLTWYWRAIIHRESPLAMTCSTSFGARVGVYCR